MARVWLKSRIPDQSVRLEAQSVHPEGAGYRDIVRMGRRFRFSHETVLHTESGTRETWLIFLDVGEAA